MFLTSLVWEEVKLASEPFVGFHSFSSKTEAPGGDIAREIWTRVFMERRARMQQDSPELEIGTIPFTAPPFLPASACVWLSALMCDLYSFPIIVFSIQDPEVFSTEFIFSQRVFIGMLLGSMKQKLNSLQHTAKRKVLHTESLLKLAPKMKKPLSGPAPLHAALQRPVSGRLSCLLLRAATPWFSGPDDFCQEARDASCVMDSLRWNSNCMKTLLLSPY